MSTSAQYARHFRQFTKWYEVMGKGIMEDRGMQFVDEDLWLMWLAWHWKCRAYSTIVKMVFAIKHHYIMLFGFDPFKAGVQGNRVEYLRFQRGLRQIKRLDKDKKRRPKLSLTKFMLQDMVHLFDFEVFEDCLYWAISTIGVSCLLRWSEICKTNNDAKLLKDSDLKKMRNGAYRISLNDTKTKLFGDPMEVSFSKDGTITCPVAALKRLRSFRSLRSRRFLFADKKGNAVKARVVQDFLKSKLKRTDLDPIEWSEGISLRKGGALTMALCGVPDRVIRAYGRWKSYAYRIYIDLTEREKLRWASVIKCQLNGSTETAVSRSDVSLKALMDD